MFACFAALTRPGSRHAAATELNVTEGAVARQLRALEKRLHAPLFESIGRRHVRLLSSEALTPLAGLLPLLSNDAGAMLVLPTAANCVSWTRALPFVTRSVATKLTDLVTGVTDCARSGV